MVPTVGNIVDGCYVVTPSGETIEFKPNNGSVENRYVLLESNPMTDCQVAITIVDENDTGEWTIYFKSAEKKVSEVKTNIVVKVCRTVAADTVEAEIGDEVQLMVPTVGNIVDGCYVVTPSGETIEFKPNNGSVENRYVLLESNPMTDCQVAITIVDENDTGEWTIYFKSAEKKVSEVKTNIVVKGQIEDVEEENGDNYEISERNPETRVLYLGTTTLVVLQITVKGGAFEECGIRNSTGSLARDGENGITQVNAGSFNCRYEIGPLTEQLLGEWTVFLRYSLSGRSIEVRQPFDLQKEDPSNPSPTPTDMGVEDLEPLKFIGSVGLEEEVSIAGHKHHQISSCHIKTPTGLQYTLMDGFNLNGVEYQNGPLLCSVTVKMVSEDMFGEWVLIARKQQGKIGPAVEQRVHVTFMQGQIEDVEEENGDNYEISERNPETRVLYLGTTTLVVLQITVKGGAFEECGIRNSTGSLARDGENGITQVNAGSFNCRYEIGPLTEQLLGEWTVFLRYSLSGRSIEVRQPFDLQKEDPSNPSPTPTDMGVEDLEPLKFIGSVGLEEEVSIAGHKHHQISSCHIRTPTGLQYTLMDGFNLNGVEYQNGPLLCSVTVKMVSEDMFGEWVLIARKQQGKIGPAVEQRVHVTFMQESTTETVNGTIVNRLARINYVVRPYVPLEISLKKIPDHVTCKLTDPNGSSIIGEDDLDHWVKLHTTENNTYATCRAVIRAKDDLLGDWELCQMYTQNEQKREECQPATLAWNNDNPDSFWQNNTQPIFNHPVHFNGTIQTGVSNSGNIRTCHVITPEGNDITVNQNSGYPYITRIAPLTQCSVSIGPIDDKALGDWVVYGVYTGFEGATETRLPIHMFLYDPENPYEQAYNVSRLNPVIRTINLGTSIDLELQVSASRATRDACSIRSPSGKLVLDNSNAVTTVDVGSQLACQYRLGPISESTLGEWEVSLKYQLNNMFTEVRQVFVVQREDPANPILDEERPIEFLPSQNINTVLGSTHEFFINDQSRVPIENCHIRTPQNLQYTVMDGFNVPGVEAITNTSICRVSINVNSTSMLGEWTLIARKGAFKYSPAKEERLNFTIYIEEYVEAIPKEISIYENNDLLLRLANDTDLFETCELRDPDGDVYPLAERNPIYQKQCGFIVKGISKNLNGTWEIVYGNVTTYKAFVDVFVHSTSDIEFPSLTWNVDDEFNGFIGPENIKYCRIMDPRGTVMFDNFGRCEMNINRITRRHGGIWSVSVGLEGKVVLRDHDFSVTVRGVQSASTPVVNASVETSSSTVVLSCSVTTSKPMEVCKFQHDSGKVIIPTMGVSEDKYSFFGDGSRAVPGGYENNCGIRISNPTVQDMGIWRCAVSTSAEVIYGFLSAEPTPAMKSSGIVTRSEPTLKLSKGIQEAVEGEEVVVSCSIMTPIHYCYFRSTNGSVFHLPGIQSDVIEYHGAGLAAGECGMRFKSIAAEDSGVWSCNVGFSNHLTEQRQEFYLLVREQLLIEQFENHNQLIVNAIVHQYNNSAVDIEHCRYVRIDGLAFTSHNPPEGYTVTTNNDGCVLYIDSPSVLDHHPWSVTVRIQNHDEEYSGISRPNLPEGPPPLPPPPHYNGSSIFGFWTMMIFIMVMIPIMVLSITSKKHRDWTYNRFNNLRNSFRSGAIIPVKLPIGYENSGYQTEKVPVG